jgi:peptide subunit release factor 1 (eRF1)
MVLGIDGTIQKLHRYNNSAFPILSVYLDISQEPDYQKQLEQQFNGLVLRNLAQKQRKQLIQDLQYMEAFLQEFKNTKQYQGIAIFSGGNRLWEVINTPFRFHPNISVAHSPHLAPLTQQLQEYQRYLVVLADREKARLFTIRAGRVEDQEDVIDPSVPQNVKASEEQYYGRADKISRHIQEHLHRHFKLIATHINKFVEHKSITGVIVGGHDTLIHKTEEYLPKQLKKKVVAEFISELNVTLSQIADHSMKIISKVNTPYSPVV